MDEREEIKESNFRAQGMSVTVILPAKLKKTHGIKIGGKYKLYKSAQKDEIIIKILEEK
jgi:hypothetical protein